MRFNPKARLDTSRVRDGGRGAGGGLGAPGGGGMRIPMPGGTKAGGGVGLVLIIVVLILSQCSGIDLTGALNGTGAAGYSTSRFQGDDSTLYASCQSGQDANDHPDTCGLVAVENSLVDYWQDTLAQQAPSASFQPEAAIVTFSGSAPSGCGQASSAMGPFYCPTDQSIYFDPSFFHDILQGQLNGPSGAFVEPYVIGHEFGHHIQNLLGTMRQVKTQEGPTSDSVRLELQADCYAGMWTRGAAGTTDEKGVAIFSSITQDDINTAISAAKAVGDDYIERQGGQQVNKESWTHGSSAQRVHWFTTGYNASTMKECDTFSASKL